jgi:hypothetical protein
VSATLRHSTTPFLKIVVDCFDVLVIENFSDFSEVDVMTMLEDDLLTVLKELQEAALVMTSGQLPSADDMERFNRAIEWSKRVIALAERTV